jgi:hypothetical protein
VFERVLSGKERKIAFAKKSSLLKCPNKEAKQKSPCWEKD